jgi:hypothetical protein
LSNETVIKVRVDEQGTIQFFDELGNKMQETAKSADSTSEGFTKTQASLVTLQAGLALATTAFTALSAAAAVGIAAIRRGSEVDDISSSFQNLSKQAGAAGDALLSKLSAALGDTIPKFDLMKQANELLIGGIDPSQFELLAKASRSLGEATGVSAKQGMEALSDSLLKGNDRALKTLGIIVDNKKAEEDYAASLGKTREQLTEQERVLALRNASLNALSIAQGKLGNVTDDAADQLDKMTASIQNAQDDFTKAIANNEALNGALGDLAKTVSEINFTELANSTAVLAAALVDLTNVAIKTASVLKQIAMVVPGLRAAFESFEMETQARRAADLTKRFTELQQKGLAGLKTQLNTGGDALKSMGEKALGVGKIFTDLIGANFNLSDSIDRTTGEFKGLVGPTATAAQLADKVKINFTGAGRALKTELTPAAKEAAEAMSDLEVEAANLIATGKELGQNPIDILFGSQSVGLESGVFSDLGSKIGSQIAEGLQQSINLALTGGKGEDYRAAISGLITDGLAAAADSYIPGSGQFVQAFGGAIEKGIEHVFGGENAGTTARKAADKFFADAFDADRLFVIIEGELKQIEDLVFQGDTLFGGNSQFTDGSFSGFFSTLSAEAQAAFGGVGLAFEELLGVSEDITGQIGAVLANNIGGSLNNLQLLVQSSGKSFEELRTSVVEAFLDGKVSALEAQTALNGLAQVAQDGIPDAIGATVQAFENMQAAGAKGGRALIDAFKDIGFEAKELGIKDFGALAQNIIASGKYSTEQVGIFFDELKKQGIDNVEELANASNEQLISIGSALQASGFLEEAANSTAELIETINDLPNEKTLTFNIKTNFDSNTKAAQDQGYVPKLSTAGSSVSY